MTMTIDRTLDQALQRYGDDLYRLAVFLTPDVSHASNALLQASRRLAAAPAGPLDARQLVDALLGALPAEGRGARRTPSWAETGRGAAEDAALLAAVARLPRSQRLALGLGLLRSFEPLVEHGGQAPASDAQAHGDDPSRAALAPAALARDRLAALHALAAEVLSETEQRLLSVESAPEECRPARAALLRDDEQVLGEPAIRGHLALCAECRAAAAAWRRLNERVEETLRAALRNIHMPPGLQRQLQSAALAGQQRRRALLERVEVRRALVALAVLAAIVALVFPRSGAAPVPTGGSGQMRPPEELIRLAQERLYTPPAGRGIWLARYAVRWIFPDASYADLEGSLWIDPQQRRHRVQLVHSDGGGPFELQIGDGERRLWYSVEPRYAASIYPQVSERWPARVQLELSADEQERMLAARMDSGAWELPKAYLRQASEAEELGSWGRSIAEDGTELAVVSFQGVSPLGLPDGVANASQVTVLLSLSIADGTLYEVRELVGSQEGEQSGRTVWRYLGGEWLSPTAANANVFEPGRATAQRDFAPLAEGAAAPELPIVPATALQQLAQVLIAESLRPLAPLDAPPGAEYAALIGGMRSAVVFYFGPGRRLAIQTGGRRSGIAPLPSSRDTERVELGERVALLRPGLVQRYEAFFGDATGERYSARISAQGFSRSELLDVLATLEPISIETVRRQESLFLGPRPADPAAFDTLLGALAEAPLPEGSVRHTVTRVFTRQLAADDRLADPYHLPPYGGRPETLLAESWTRAAAEGALERAIVRRGADSTVYDRAYFGPRGAWEYDAPRGEVVLRGDAQAPDWERLLLTRMLVCGGARVVQQGGDRAVALTEKGWHQASCLLPRYTGMYGYQHSGVTYVLGLPGAQAEFAPYLADLAGEPLTVTAAVDDEGRLKWLEVSAGAPGGGQSRVVIERWEVLSDELLPAERVPADVFSSVPPQTLTRRRGDGAGPGAPSDLIPLNLAQARGLLADAVYAFEETPASGGSGQAQVVLRNIFTSRFDSDEAYGFYQIYPSPFENALYHSAALRFDYTVTDGAGQEARLSIYQGRAERFGAYLRARARWTASEPLAVTVEGEPVQGWLVTTLDGQQWAIFEAGGTLVAAPAGTPEQRALLGRLRRV